MTSVLLVVHLLIALALVAVVLLQRSEGGALGIGGGGGGGGGLSGLMSGRGAANALTRATAVLAACFFATSIGLTLLAQGGREASSVLDAAPADSAPADETTPSTSTPSEEPAVPPVPTPE